MIIHIPNLPFLDAAKYRDDTDGGSTYYIDGLVEFWSTSTSMPPWLMTTFFTPSSAYPVGDNSKSLQESPRLTVDADSWSPVIANHSRRDHITFIKTHKCASSTIQNILMRYGYKNKLTFVLPKNKGNHLGWSQPFDPSKHMRKTNGKPDVLCYHSVFSPKMVSTMPDDSFYLTAVREPLSQVRSSYIYYSMYGCSKMTLKQLITGVKDGRMTQYFRCAIPIMNPVLFDLGMPVKDMKDVDKIRKYIDTLDKRFDLVIVLDYFD